MALINMAWDTGVASSFQQGLSADKDFSTASARGWILQAASPSL